MKEKLITKTSGEKEPFNKQKIIRSLQAVGTQEDIIQSVIKEIEQQYPKIRNTQQIFSIALEKLKKHDIGAATRYNLKKALLAFGPTGYPFEKFVARILKAQGYKVKTNVEGQGHCVSHEIDVVAIKDAVHHMVECKFHNSQGYITGIKTALYVDARMKDLAKGMEESTQEDQYEKHQGWLATNTQFSPTAIDYSQCVQLNLLGWKYPKDEGIADLVKKYNLHPITALTELSTNQKKQLLKKGLVMCSEVPANEEILYTVGFSDTVVKKLVNEAQKTCSIRASFEKNNPKSE